MIRQEIAEKMDRKNDR